MKTTPALCGYEPGVWCNSQDRICVRCPTYHGFKQTAVKSFSETMLANLLTAEHESIGFYLVEDEDFLYLMKQGDPLPQKIFSSKAVTLHEIRYEADQLLNWTKSGIIFERADSKAVADTRQE